MVKGRNCPCLKETWAQVPGSVGDRSAAGRCTHTQAQAALTHTQIHTCMHERMCTWPHRTLAASKSSLIPICLSLCPRWPCTPGSPAVPVNDNPNVYVALGRGGKESGGQEGGDTWPALASTWFPPLQNQLLQRGEALPPSSW